MKFKKEIISHIRELLDKHELNLSISDILSTIFGNIEIASKKEIDLLTNRFNCSSKSAFLSKISEYLDIDLSFEDNEEIINQNVFDCIHELDATKYLNNPYYKAFKNAEAIHGEYELKKDKYQPYEIFAYQDMASNDYVEINSLGYFKEEFPFIALNHQGVTWMNITPNEIETMEKAVKEAKGKILVFGLGLGYFPYMALLKEDVKSVTIIENDQNIISLFNSCLKDKFPHQEKLSIIYDDANNYINKIYSHDYVFVDLWHNPEDGIDFFLKFKATEKINKNSKFFYWLESSFYLYLRRCMFTLLGEQIEKDVPSNYIKAKTMEDKIINAYYQKTKNLLVNSKEELDNLLSEDTLINLLLND